MRTALELYIETQGNCYGHSLLPFAKVEACTGVFIAPRVATRSCAMFIYVQIYVTQPHHDSRIRLGRRKRAGAQTCQLLPCCTRTAGTCVPMQEGNKESVRIW